MHRLYLKGFLNRTLQVKSPLLRAESGVFRCARCRAFPVSFATFSEGSRDEFLQFLESDVSTPAGSRCAQLLWTKHCSEICASLTCSCTTNIRTPKSDIQIAQETPIRPILDVARTKLGIDPERPASLRPPQGEDFARLPADPDQPAQRQTDSGHRDHADSRRRRKDHNDRRVSATPSTSSARRR